MLENKNKKIRKKFFKHSKNKGVALVTTIIVISMIGFLIQGVFSVAQIRARNADRVVQYAIAKQSARDGISCALYLAIRKNAFSENALASCLGEVPTYNHTILENYDYQFYLKSSGQGCASLYIDVDGDVYTILSNGYNRCKENNEPDRKAPDFQSHSIIQRVNYSTTNGITQVSPIGY